MPQPTQQQVHIDVALTNISVAYLQDENDYVADKVFPIVPVQKQSDRYFVYDKGDFLRDEADLRADGTESAGGGYDIDNTPTYYADVWAYHKDVGPQVRANSDVPLDADRDATIFVTQKLAIKREVEFLSKFFAPSTWTGAVSGGDVSPGTDMGANAWDAANSTPIEDVEKNQFNIKQVSGKWPNRFVLGANVYRALKNHTEILDRLKYVQRGIITPELLAAIFAPPNAPEAADGGGFRVMVAAAIRNTAAKGASDSMSFIATQQDALLCYAEPNPGILRPTAGYVFTWVPIAGYQARIRQIPMPWLGVDNQGTPTMRIEGESAFSCKQVAADMGVYFDGVVS